MTSTARSCLRGRSRCGSRSATRRYRILLSSENQDKLLEALKPFTATAKVEDPSRRMNNMRLVTQPKG